MSPTIYGDLGDGLLLLYPYYSLKYEISALQLVPVVFLSPREGSHRPVLRSPASLPVELRRDGAGGARLCSKIYSAEKLWQRWQLHGERTMVCDMYIYIYITLNLYVLVSMT